MNRQPDDALESLALLTIAALVIISIIAWAYPVFVAIWFAASIPLGIATGKYLKWRGEQ
jgi:hypothetical protein